MKAGLMQCKGSDKDEKPRMNIKAKKFLKEKLNYALKPGSAIIRTALLIYFEGIDLLFNIN